MSEYARLFLSESQNRFSLAWERVEHCLNQLDDEHMWWSPGPKQNPIGTLILHLCGNLRQWVIAGVGSAPDTRTRWKEFEPQPHLTKAALQGMLRDVIGDIQKILESLPEEELLKKRRIQASDVTGLAAIYKAITHMEIHVGQMLFLTRMQVGGAYRDSWTPRTKEEGLPD